MTTKPCPGCGTPIDARHSQCVRCRYPVTYVVPPTPSQQIEKDRQVKTERAEVNRLRRLYEESLKTIERQAKELQIVGQLGSIDTFDIETKLSSKNNEGTPVLVASDWHLEERVGPEVGNLNRFNLDIARQRGENFFHDGLKLIQILGNDINIHDMVLPLLGDFISSDIHEEVAELAELAPIHAVLMAQEMLASGIEYLLKNSHYNLIIPCHSGNHARTTKKTHFSAENGHSLEYFMYRSLQNYFRTEPRVTFIIPDGYHSYLNVYDQTIRCHHGHAIKYNGGVGGIYIPTNKAIAQWNKGRHADMDVFGHFHSLRDGGNFVSNGSLIGYNGFALSIKADYEPPKQALFLMDKKRGRTVLWQVYV